ncbi:MULTISPECIES: patatin-like phospholipase family protein [unclassified Microcoleus]|uniref:patatin-like phospholipase family protein n=1 Tax=unclassified Microcoleus TaxID=2642155 RepID=UPI0025F0F694|nr:MULTISPECIES: patatin-like phospholipase family protein [unclassified Microcoleus]
MEAYCSIDQLIDLYRKGEKIFKEPAIESFTKIDDLTKPKYSSKGRQFAIDEVLGETTLDRALTNILIPAYDIESRMPIFFVNNSANTQTRNFQKLSDATMAQAAMATTAAPTFFEPYQLGGYALIDGGVFANNPASFAIAECLRIAKNISEITLVSLGTGNLTRKYSGKEAKNWGMLQWLEPLINIMMDGMSESVAIELEYILKPQQYYRFQSSLTIANDDIDDASPQNIFQLEALAKSIILEKGRELDELCSRIC